MTKTVRADLDHVAAIASSNPDFAASKLAVLHRCAATKADARLMERMAIDLLLSVQYVNGCMIVA